jgi:hypothetical protein
MLLRLTRRNAAVDLTPEARAVLRHYCNTRGHTYTCRGAPLGSILCRVCSRWEADPLWLPHMDEDDETTTTTRKQAA